MALQRQMWYTDLPLINLDRSNDLAILFLMPRTPCRHNLGHQQSLGEEISVRTDKQTDIHSYILRSVQG